MVSPTLLVCLRKSSRCSASNSCCFRSLALRLTVLCFPLFTGCGAGGDSALDPARANLLLAHGQDSQRPTITLNPTTLDFSATQGASNPADQAVPVSNSGTGTLNWTVSSPAPWLALFPVSGSAPASFNATAIVAGLAAGTYSTTITVTATGATNTPESIPVTFTVSIAASSPPPPAPATASVTLTWNPETDPSVVGYYVHYGPQSQNSAGSCAYAQSTYYPVSSLTNTSSPTAILNGLATGTTWFFAVSAYNGVEGPCSNEVSKST